MTQFVFDQIPSGPLIQIDSDSVIFHGGSASQASVVFGTTANNIGQVAITFAGHTVDFDSGIVIASANMNLIFDDGSHLLIGGPRNEIYDGAGGNDALFGGDGEDVLSGHEGANLLQGNQGNDTLTAGIGADTIFGGKDDDIIQSSPADIGHGEVGDFVNGNLGADSISSGNGDDTLLGGQGNDEIFGEGGRDFLNGNLGDDRVIADGAAQMFGEAGNDTLTARGDGATLTGGAGNDLFVFVGAGNTVGGARGAITDFAPEDSISFSGVLANHAYAEIQAADFASALAQASQITSTSLDPMRAGGEVVVAQVGGDLYAFATFFNSQTPNTAILLIGRTLADIDASDII